MLGLFFCDPGVTKSPIQLPKTFTTVTTSFPPVLILLFAKLTRLAIICASPVLILLLPPVLLLASFPPVFADKSRLFTIFALFDCSVVLFVS